MGSVVVDGPGSIGSSGSLTTLVSVSVVDVVESAGSSGSLTVVGGMAGPAVVTDPEVEPSVDGGTLVLGVFGEVVLGTGELWSTAGSVGWPGTQVGEVPGEDGICTEDPGVSVDEDGAVEGRSALGGFELTDGGGSSSSTGGAVDGAGFTGVAGAWVPVGADAATVDRSPVAPVWSVSPCPMLGSGVVSTISVVVRWDVTPPTSGLPSFPAGLTLTLRASIAW